ncbi:hypothetical protein LNTAR_22095 [Lentisphaera araneosa HTCC2155]|uniref:Transposase DDE domain-containing protein n=1 Tax=Lentisphaera araneosa HTCC2155 TaxID=313628 RepID=A6DSN0_9BACT|nr:IS1380-like element ISLar3 family transposase [Lentisphaera araneosa]EDM25383.1 hypothetical protein LNTAR_22095 [Lentisphaera araneosa HTCC2155]
MNKAFKLDTGNDSLHSIGGIFLGGQVLQQSEIDDEFRTDHKANHIFQDVDIFKSQVGLLIQGRERFTDISQFRENEVFTKSLGLNKVPSEERLRQRLEIMSSEHEVRLKSANTKLIKKQSIGSLSRGGMDFIPLDMDVSPMDNSGSHKENVSWTYKNHDGFSPMFAYLGIEGFMLNNELRPGSQHAQKGMPEFLDESFTMIKKLKLKHPVLLRLDSAHDAEVNFDHLPDDQYFLIKRNLRKESKEQWLSNARRLGRQLKSRDGKNVFVGELHHRQPGNNEERKVVPFIFKVTEQLEDQDGNRLLMPEIEVETYWTNLPLEAEDVIELYHDHGTSEQFHSELKSDMNVERLPSGKFKANQFFLHCAMLAFNVLRVIGNHLIHNKSLAPIKIKVQRRRLRCVIRDLIFIACKHVKHAGDEFLKFGRHCPWFKLYQKISFSL